MMNDARVRRKVKRWHGAQYRTQHKRMKVRPITSLNVMGMMDTLTNAKKSLAQIENLVRGRYEQQIASAYDGALPRGVGDTWEEIVFGAQSASANLNKLIRMLNKRADDLKRQGR